MKSQFIYLFKFTLIRKNQHIELSREGVDFTDGDFNCKNCIRIKLSVPRRWLPAQMMWGLEGEGVFNSCR